LSRCDNPARKAGGKNWVARAIQATTLRRSARRYSSQRDEFHHVLNHEDK